jgi:DNA-binding GntR family transcriptional regulator
MIYYFITVQTMRKIATFRSKKALAYDSLRSSIMDGRLKPGARLVIADLAAKLGVSHIPVREALQQLHAEGFVVLEPNLGARVTEIHDGMMAEIFDLLEAAEVSSGRAACHRMSDQDIEEMERLLRDMDTLTGDPGRWSQKNVLLHRFICDRAGTVLAASVMERVLDHWDRLRRLRPGSNFERRILDAQKGHWQMLEALRDRDPQRVEKMIREHNAAARRAYGESETPSRSTGGRRPKTSSNQPKTSSK